MPQLRVNRPGDRYEREADRMAGQVMRMPANATSTRVRRGRDVHRDRPSAASPPAFLPAGGARPLAPQTRAVMEPHFGTDFSDVRLHTGVEAQCAAARLNARAFTYGRDIWLGEDASEGDRHLMAHELTHVVQQSRFGPGRAAYVQRQQDDEEGFSEYFTNCMESMGLPVPSSLFNSVTTATATIAAINAAVTKFGTSVTVAELVGAGLLSEKLLVAGSLTASFYAGAAVGCLATATGESISGGYSLGDALYDALGPEPGLWIADTFGI